MLRLVLWRAQQSKEGINRSEGKMIENLLNMQETEVCSILSRICLILGVVELFYTSEIIVIIITVVELLLLLFFIFGSSNDYMIL